MTIRYLLDDEGGFTVGDTVTGATCYAYPTSYSATQAKRKPGDMARDMLGAENRFRDGRIILPCVADSDRRNFERIGGAMLSGASGFGEG